MTFEDLERMYKNGTYASQTNIGITKDLLLLSSWKNGDTMDYDMGTVPHSNTLWQLFHLKDSRKNTATVVLYLEGVGTQEAQGHLLVDSIFGNSVTMLVEFAFTFLCQLMFAKQSLGFDQEIRGDKLTVLGFSRGAVQARLFCKWLDLTGGFLHVTEKQQTELTGLVWALLKVVDDPQLRAKQCSELKEKLQTCDTTKATVDFLGVFDTVPGFAQTSLGSFLTLASKLTHKLRPTERHVTLTTIENLLMEQPVPTCCARVAHAVALHDDRIDFKPLLFHAPSDPKVDEVWFPGYHCDVGGGYDGGDDNRHAFPDFVLAWMLSKLAAATGIDLPKTTFLVFDKHEKDEYLRDSPLAYNYRPKSHPRCHEKFMQLHGDMRMGLTAPCLRAIPPRAKLSPLLLLPEFCDDPHFALFGGNRHWLVKESTYCVIEFADLPAPFTHEQEIYLSVDKDNKRT
eukprot:TRINITY_DN115775_c0_g1_i1.p1 TRINITY_DN115775_c0_g1~~TRINITY_DN115775_c0_g1_i1.p1  ORF type:complete len:455 (+),score=53.18 TRINITY_DN115775_c0_g1_i1:203-1567(+)